jgi:2-C-methyl-D-erythritol 2,4-cyclodiphosphate synthase
VCDAILGAISQPDIGQLFPDSDPQWQAATSDVFVKEAVRIASEMEYEVCNIDVTLIAQQPKMAPHKESMRMNVASFLDVPLGRVNVKAKTHEKVDSLGENRSIACHTVALLAHSNVMHMLQLS